MDDAECQEPRDNCRPEYQHRCGRPLGHDGYHGHDYGA